MRVYNLTYYFVPLCGEKGWKEAGFGARPDLFKRLDILCAAYGQFTANDIFTELQNWLQEELRRVRELGGEKDLEPWAAFFHRGDDAEILEDLAWLTGGNLSIWKTCSTYKTF